MIANAASFAISKALSPWLIVASVLAISVTGVAGMYAGYEIANARHARAVSELKDAQIAALKARTDQYLEAVSRGDQVAGDFYDALRNIKVVNTSITQEVRREVEKLVYTDCRLPDSGADLLSKKVDEINMRLLGPQKGKK